MDAGGFVGRKKSSPLSPKAMMCSGCACCQMSSCSAVGGGIVSERYVGCVPAEQKRRGCLAYVLETMERRFCCCASDVAMDRRMVILAETALSRIVVRSGRWGFLGDCLSMKKSR